MHRSLILLIALSTPLLAQQPPVPQQPPAPIERATPAAPPPLAEIYVDQNCRIAEQDSSNPNAHPNLRTDPIVCHLEGVQHTQHNEHEDDGAAPPVSVEVSERTYFLTNVTPGTLNFIVHQPLPAGWSVDSVPPPIATTGNSATFSAFVEPGQTVTLHTGERRESPISTPVSLGQQGPAAVILGQLAQQGPPPPAAEIHVDQNCRIYAQDRTSTSSAYSHPYLRTDPDVCQLRRVLHTKNRYEETVEDGVVKRTRYEIAERNYILHNVTTSTVAFIVQQPLPKGWFIDSDPAPDSTEGETATFRVYANPGQTIHLHVGERH